MRSSLQAQTQHHKIAAKPTGWRLSRAMALLAAGFALIALSASCGSSAKSTKPSKASAPTTKEETPTPAPTAQPDQTTDPGQNTTTRTMYVNVDAANVRSGPAKDQPIVAKLKFLDPVTATGALNGDWVEIQLTSGDGGTTKAWIHSSLISASTDQAKAVHGTP